jgi:hypothetical protein
MVVVEVEKVMAAALKAFMLWQKSVLDAMIMKSVCLLFVGLQQQPRQVGLQHWRTAFLWRFSIPDSQGENPSSKNLDWLYVVMTVLMALFFSIKSIY